MWKVERVVRLGGKFGVFGFYLFLLLLLFQM